MKKIIYAILAIMPMVSVSQNMYDITNLIDDASVGSARFVSMGCSMGALGGDVSVMGTNPAGTAIYRSSDFNLTAVMNSVSNNARFNGMRTPSNYTNTNLSNAGFVLAFETGEPNVKYLNFGANVRRKSNWSNNFSVKGASDGFSQQYIINDLYNGQFDVFNINADMYQSLEYDWLALLATDAGLYDDKGNLLLDSDGKLIHYPYNWGYHSEERGSLDIFDINIAANINDFVYVGATLGYYNLDYSRFSTYYESDEMGKIYTLDNDYNISGSGFDLKFGAIIRPIPYSPFKLAAFVHTPVFYKLLQRSWASMDGPGGVGFKTYDERCYGDDYVASYALMTPWKFGAAMSYTFGRFLALNAEYEYADASTTLFTDGADADLAQNDEIGRNLKPQHTVRIGAEFLWNKLAFRAGYNYVTSAFGKDAYKNMYNATMVDTSTEYMNKFDKKSVTCGIGYIGENIYIDLGYKFQQQRAEFYPYYDYEYENPAATVKTVGHSIYAGIGIRF